MSTPSTGNGLPDVVVTAIAATTSLATDAEATWQALLNGRSGIRTLHDPYLDKFDSPVRIGGRLLEEFDNELSRVELRRLAYQAKMSTVVGRRVWQNAGKPEVDTTRLTVSIGVGLGATEEMYVSYDDVRARGMKAVSPLAVQMFMPNAAAAAVGLERHAKAGVMTPAVGDASGAAGIAAAWRQIVLGDADIAICGGVETRIEAVPVASMIGSHLLSMNNDDPAGACRPFDRARDGMVLGEAGALMVIETEDHAKSRGAEILARLLSAATTSDGYDAQTPDPSGKYAAEAITHAVQLAGLTPADIDHVNAHATGTEEGDLAEATAIAAAFGAHRPAVYAAKAALGHCIGAAGALEAILTVQALRDGVVPPTLNLTEPDPRIDLDVVIRRPRRSEYRYAVSNSFGLGGHNVVLAFGAY